jgi:hypothetical protein
MNIPRQSPSLIAALLFCLSSSVPAETYRLGLNEKYEQFADLKSLRDGDTILVTTDIWSYGDFRGLRVTIRAEPAVPRLTWNAGFNQDYKSTLELSNQARVTVENLDLVGAKGSAGGSYCPIFSCQNGEPGGTGRSAVKASAGTLLQLKHCALRGGAGGPGGVYGSRSCAVCGCSPCGSPPTYASEGRVGLGMELSGAVAETLDVKVDTVWRSNGGKLVPCCSDLPVSLRSLSPRPAAAPMSLEADMRDLRGRKCLESRPLPIWLAGHRPDR